MASQLEIKELSIVLVGLFNPKIYHPQWMARKGIISAEEADAANVKISHPDVTEFDLEYCSLQVVKNRFAASSTRETHFRIINDIVRGIFDSLPECPVFQVGINLHHHYRFSSESEYVEFGHKIVPKEPLWNNELTKPGLSSIAVQGKREDDYTGHKTIHVSISTKVQPFGVQIYLNDHFELYPPQSKDADALKAIDLLKSGFVSSIEKSAEIIEGVYNYGST
jgi:hypothetical protein